MVNKGPQIDQTVAHLFRHEWGKLVTVLTKLFGPQNLQLAEDVVQDTLLKALNVWKISGLPQNPSAWLFTAARNKAVDTLRRKELYENYSKSISPLLQSEYTLLPTVIEMVNSKTIEDDQLRMMFVCCHPSLSPDAQVAIILKTLCGFSVAEIAKAFVSREDSIEKRIYRARQSLRDNKVSFELPMKTELDQRLETVLTAIYLLFNEGYNSTAHETLIRADLMQEATRLGELICSSSLVRHSQAHALLSLMYFTAGRNDARLDAEGNILLLKQQDRTKWDPALFKKAVDHLEQSARTGDQISKYHIEAGIAFEHAKAASYADTNWQHILHYYDLLCQYFPTPVIALNRAVVLSELAGPEEAIREIASIKGLETIRKYYLLPATLGELYAQLQQYEKAIPYLLEAIGLTQSATEKKLLQQKLTGYQKARMG